MKFKEIFNNLWKKKLIQICQTDDIGLILVKMLNHNSICEFYKITCYEKIIAYFLCTGFIGSFSFFGCSSWSEAIVWTILRPFQLPSSEISSNHWRWIYLDGIQNPKERVWHCWGSEANFLPTWPFGFFWWMDYQRWMESPWTYGRKPWIWCLVWK